MAWVNIYSGVCVNGVAHLFDLQGYFSDGDQARIRVLLSSQPGTSDPFDFQIQFGFDGVNFGSRTSDFYENFQAGSYERIYEFKYGNPAYNRIYGFFTGSVDFQIQRFEPDPIIPVFSPSKNTSSMILLNERNVVRIAQLLAGEAGYVVEPCAFSRMGNWSSGPDDLSFSDHNYIYVGTLKSTVMSVSDPTPNLVVTSYLNEQLNVTLNEFFVTRLVSSDKDNTIVQSDVVFNQIMTAMSAPSDVSVVHSFLGWRIKINS